mmetsp:Transcript_8022/g.18918  ORF Transcript_8022/g.18918 Transcript_8022/m.18918 type:complete len:207 (+) Transcript_8022:466-1086(+)
MVSGFIDATSRYTRLSNLRPPIVHRFGTSRLATVLFLGQSALPAAVILSTSLRWRRKTWRPVEPSVAFMNQSEFGCSAHCALRWKNSWQTSVWLRSSVSGITWNGLQLFCFSYVSIAFTSSDLSSIPPPRRGTKTPLFPPVGRVQNLFEYHIKHCAYSLSLERLLNRPGFSSSTGGLVALMASYPHNPRSFAAQGLFLKHGLPANV